MAWDHTSEYLPRPVWRTVALAPTPDGGVVELGMGWDQAVSEGPADIVVMSRNSDGDQRWTRVLSSPAYNPNSLYWNTASLNSQYADVAVGFQGRVLVVYSLPTHSELLCLDPDGSTRWVTSLLSPDGHPEYHAMHVTVDGSGTAYVAGTAYHDTFPRVGVHAVRADGSLLWAWGVGGGVGFPRGIELAPSGDVYVYGQTDYFSGFAFGAALHVLTPGGALRWVRSGGPSGSVAVRDVAFGPSGDAYTLTAGGITNSTLSFVEVRRLRPDGVGVYTLVASDLPANEIHDPSSLVVDAQEQAHLALNSTPQPFPADTVPNLARISPSGTYLGRSMISVAPTGEALGIMLAASGEVALTGVTTGISPRAFDAFFDGAGTERWAHTTPGRRYPTEGGGPFRVYGVAQASDPRGNVFVSSLRPVGGPLNASRTGLKKLLQGVPVGASQCGPAVPNSSGVAGELSAFGDAARSADNVTLLMARLPVGAFTMAIASRTPGFVPGAGGSQGNLCLGGAIGRFVGNGQIRRAGADGSASLQLDLDTLAQPSGLVAAAVGETWHFQAWYRDSLNGAPTSNFTQAIAATWQ